MICYRDMTFCNAPCGNIECSRKYTPEVLEGAIKWWGSDKAPIALSDFSSACEDYLPASNPPKKVTELFRITDTGGHSNSSMYKSGTYKEGITKDQVEPYVKGTFGGRWDYFRDGKFRYIAYTD